MRCIRCEQFCVRGFTNSQHHAMRILRRAHGGLPKWPRGMEKSEDEAFLCPNCGIIGVRLPEV